MGLTRKLAKGASGQSGPRGRARKGAGFEVAAPGSRAIWPNVRQGPWSGDHKSSRTCVSGLLVPVYSSFIRGWVSAQWSQTCTQGFFAAI